MEETLIPRYDRKDNKVHLKVLRKGPVKQGPADVGVSEEVINQTLDISYVHHMWNYLHDEVNKIQTELKKIGDEPKWKFKKEELDELNEKVKEMQARDAFAKSKDSKEHMEKNLKKFKNDIRVFEPIVKQLPKPAKK